MYALFKQKNEPIFSAFGSAVVNNQESKTRWKHVYVQSKSVETKLAPGDRFLYCKRRTLITRPPSLISIANIVLGACSESVTAYQEEHDVLEACKESEFVKTNIKGYQNEWFRYCYFEFNKPTYIKPHQKVIVKKKVCKHRDNLRGSHIHILTYTPSRYMYNAQLQCHVFDYYIVDDNIIII